MSIKHFLAAALSAVVFTAAAETRSEILPNLHPENFLETYEVEWLPQAHGQMAIIYCVREKLFMSVFKDCTDRIYATFHDVVDQGPKVTPEFFSQKNFPFPVRYLDYTNGNDSTENHWGYVIKKNPSVYIKVRKMLFQYRFNDPSETQSFLPFTNALWEYLAMDPCEDGINGNEIPYNAPDKKKVECINQPLKGGNPL